jgi:hypothetical protein
VVEASMTDYGAMVGHFDQLEEMPIQYVLHPVSPSYDARDDQGEAVATGCRFAPGVSTVSLVMPGV